MYGFQFCRFKFFVLKPLDLYCLARLFVRQAHRGKSWQPFSRNNASRAICLPTHSYAKGTTPLMAGAAIQLLLRLPGRHCKDCLRSVCVCLRLKIERAVRTKLPKRFDGKQTNSRYAFLPCPLSRALALFKSQLCVVEGEAKNDKVVLSTKAHTTQTDRQTDAQGNIGIYRPRRTPLLVAWRHCRFREKCRPAPPRSTACPSLTPLGTYTFFNLLLRLRLLSSTGTSTSSSKSTWRCSWRRCCTPSSSGSSPCTRGRSTAVGTFSRMTRCAGGNEYINCARDFSS